MGEIIVGEKIFIFAVIFGYVPFTKNGTFRIEKRLLIYTRFTLLLAFSMSYFMIFHHQTHRLKTSFWFLTSFTSTTGYCMACLFSMLCIQCRFGRICSVLNRIRSWWDRLNPELKKSYDKTPLTLFLKFTFVYLEFCLIAQPFASAIFKTVQFDMNSVLTRTFYFIMDQYIICSDYMFLAVAANGYFLLRHLNKVLVGVPDGCSESRGTRSRGRTLLEGVIRRVSNEYSDVLDIIHEINECFSEVNLVNISFAVTAVLAMIFYYVKTVRCVETNDPLVLFDLMYITNFYINKTIYSLLVSSLTTSEAEQTPSLLEEFYAACDDPRIMEEAEIISLQLMHRKVVFDAGGFFKLKLSLLISMTGTVITYVLILIQFEDVGLMGLCHLNYTNQTSFRNDNAF